MLRVDGQRVSQVCFDYAVTLATESGFELRVETPFVLRDALGAETRIDPEAPGDLAPRLLELLQRLIDFAVVEPSGDLLLTFVDGETVAVSAHPEFEAWTMTDPSGGRLVCLPGGGIGEWSSSD